MRHHLVVDLLRQSLLQFRTHKPVQRRHASSCHREQDQVEGQEQRQEGKLSRSLCKGPAVQLDCILAVEDSAEDTVATYLRSVRVESGRDM
jgi:hypothetical protein